MQSQVLLILAMLAPGDRMAADLLLLPADHWSAAALQTEFQSQVERVKRPATFDAPRDVPDLVLLYRAIERSETLSTRARVDLRERTAYWLDQSADRLRRQVAAQTPRLPAKPGSEKGNQPSLAAGPAELANARQLIDIIESTIDPDSWASNDGLGTITYYAPLQVLVIRNTHQVHEQIGGSLGTLRVQR